MMEQLASYVAAARPAVSSLMQKGGSLARSVIGPWSYALGGGEGPQIMQKTPTGVPWQDFWKQEHTPATTPQARVNAGFGAFPPQPGMDAEPALAQRFADMVQRRSQTEPTAPPVNPPAPAPAPQAPAFPAAYGVPEAGPYGGSPETNPNLMPMGKPYPWQGTPFAGMLDALNEKGGSNSAGLIPKFVNLIGRMST